MAKAKSTGVTLTLDKLIEYFNGQGIKAIRVNHSTVKLPYVWGTEIALPATDKGIRVLNAFHTPIRLKAKA